jgi:uncharacterized membrane protein
VLFPLLGVREITSGIGILGTSVPRNAVRARVAGDLMDLGLLGLALVTSRGSERPRVLAATAAVAGVTALDVVCSSQLGRAAGEQTESGAIQLTESIAVNRPAGELYSFWRDVENLPRVMSHLESVQSHEGGRSHWVARTASRALTWDVELTANEEGERLAWRSVDGAVVPQEGSVRFSPIPGGRGTFVTLTLQMKPPGGAIGAAVAQLFAKGPQHQIKNDLRRWKQLVETGEVPTTEGQPHGRRSPLSRHLP